MSYLTYFVSPAVSPFPFPQGSADGPYAMFPGSGLGAYRPNQALDRVYSNRRSLAGLGDLSVGGVQLNTPLLIGGVVLLALAGGLFGRKKLRSYRGRRLRRKRTRISRQIRALES